VTTPRVSVVMPVFNGAAHLRPALDSILTQTLRDLELVAVDDGSTDETPAILAAVRDPRLRVIRQDHGGMVSALNRGIREARAALVARMDADDISLPHRLEAQMRYLERHRDVALVGGGFAHVDEDDRRLNDAVGLPRTHEGIAWAMLRGRLGVLHATAVVRRQVLLALRGYDPDFRHSEDVEFFARLIQHHRAANLPGVVYLWRIRRGSICSVRVARQRANEAQVRRLLWRAVLTGRYRPSEAQRRRARARSDEDEQWVGGAVAEAAYHSRVGYALLAGGRRADARRALARSIRLYPWQRTAYAGMIRSFTARWTPSTSI